MRYFRLLQALVRVGVLFGCAINLIYAGLGSVFFYVLTFPQDKSADWNHTMALLNQVFLSQPLQSAVQYTAPTLPLFGGLVLGYIMVQMFGGLKEKDLDDLIAQIRVRWSTRWNDIGT